MKPIGQQLLFNQLTIELELQLGDTEGSQLWRQQTQNIVALLKPVHLFRYGGRFAHQAAKGFHRRIFFRHRFRFT